jgi:regulator of protease activity HflC (stomatin/prohibitin superfamily)
MKKFILLAIISLIAFVGCSKVPAGSVGIKVYMLGSNKGVDNEVLGVGRYWIGMNEELFIFPTYQVNYTYTKDVGEGDPLNEEFIFQTNEGMECKMDMGISMHFDKDKISRMFQTYRKGPDEIRQTVVRNALRDALNVVAGNMPVESVYGNGKSLMIDSVQALAKQQLDTTGIVIDKVSLIGSIRIPDQVKEALDMKVAATQKAQQRENELREAEATAKKLVAQAQGEAESNKIKASSLTSAVIEWQRLQNETKAIEKWNGVLPTVTSGATPLINLK